MLLLVGGTGLLGSAVAERLAQRNVPFRAGGTDLSIRGGQRWPR